VSQSLIIDPDLDRLRMLVARAREQLSDAESEYMMEKARVAAMQAELFALLWEEYQRRDTLRLLVSTRRAQLEAMKRGEARAEAEVNANTYFREESARVGREYEETATEVAGKCKLGAEEKAEIARLWKKLVKLYHPDRFAAEPGKLETYHKLTSLINKAKEAGDFSTLREIADEPHSFIARQGWSAVDLGEDRELVQLRRLHEALLLEITAVLDSIARLRATPEFQLCLRCDFEPEGLAGVAASLRNQAATECERLQEEAEGLQFEIEQLRTA
jgi:hypothetical protein